MTSTTTIVRLKGTNRAEFDKVKEVEWKGTPDHEIIRGHFLGELFEHEDGDVYTCEEVEIL